MGTIVSLGDKAPDFSLPSTAGTSISLTDYRGRKHVVLVFYVRDSTPGWTRQLAALRDDRASFEALDAVILGINPGSMNSHERFASRYQLGFPLLVDADSAVAEAYGALKDDGKIQRTVVIVDKAGIICYYRHGMPSDEELLAAIQNERLRRLCRAGFGQEQADDGDT